MRADTYDWLPELFELNKFDGDWGAYLDAAYGYFVADFITDEPVFLGRTVKSKRHVAYEGKDHSFWHCVEEQCKGEMVSEDNRVPKISLLERIRWPRPVIEHAISSPGVLAWTEVYRGHGAKRRVHLYLEDEGYVVVLDPRGKDEKGNPAYYFLWTTFLCEDEIARRKMLRRYEKGSKMN
ncbi:MAG: hypothetical protein PUD02_01500 [Eggerthellales bacterium]|nr:hypothetical protein [Eggerthellales bacterium]